MRDDIDLKYFKNLLEERLKTIITRQEQQKSEGAPVELDQSRVGRLSRMDAMQQQAMSQASARITDLERQRIESALSRMESGDFGYCIICEDEIPEGRLQFDPSVLLCISCAKDKEVEK